ncbi:hypothetical protein HA402_011473 [Bradysia odoriphaga]|nr:hypothetical protein HA402_011473 [Bradysia odoriphaga]
MVGVTVENPIHEKVQSKRTTSIAITDDDNTMKIKLSTDKCNDGPQHTSKSDADDEIVTLRVKKTSVPEIKRQKYLAVNGRCFSDGEGIEQLETLLDTDDFPEEFWHFQRDSFIHRSYNEKLLALKNASDYPNRPVSVPNDATFKRDSFIRQSFKSIRNSFSKSIRKKNGLKRSLTDIEDRNNNINNDNSTNSDKSGNKSDRAVESLSQQKIKVGHSRNSSSSSLTSNRSTNSISLGFRSAPTTPMAPLQSQSDGHGQSTVNLNSLSRSPSHLSAKIDSKSIRHLSTVPPATPSNTRSPSPHPTKSSSKNDIPEKEKKRKELSSGRQKKFHRHFLQVDADEHVINYFSCALVSDILLQGHLYITDNYFAFYSNVFGFVTKLLIPTVSVVKISKEKTAKIIPNAVGVATADERHVFGSFMSREAAYRLMLSVWKPVAPVEPELVPKIPDVEISECSIEDDSSSAISGNESPPRLQESTTSDASQTLRHRSAPSLIEGTPNGLRMLVADAIDGGAGGDGDLLSPNILPMASRSTSPPPKIVIPRKFLSFPLPTNWLYVGLVLTILLALLSGFLFYRIVNIQAKSSHYDPLDFKWNPANKDIDVYTEVLKWQKEMQSKSVDEAQIVLNSNLEKIARVRKSLETLSVLIHNKDAPSLTDYSYMAGGQDEPLDGTTFDRSKG